MDQRFIAMSAPSFVFRGGAPAIVTRRFDSADDLGRIFTAHQDHAAVYARLDRNPADPYARGSGVVVRPDGLVLGARHAVTATSGDIFVRVRSRPTFRARILDESRAEDLVLLKPITPIGGTVPYLPISAFTDHAPVRTPLVTMGMQNVSLSHTNQLTADIHIAEGKVLGKDPVRFQGEAPTERYRTDVTGEYGQSGAATYEFGTGKFVGTMLGGNDYRWSGLAPASKVRAMIVRNWTR